jgi:hypothetical protein
MLTYAGLYRNGYSQLDDLIQEYEQGTITISGDIEFSMHKTVRQITHYILSR